MSDGMPGSKSTVAEKAKNVYDAHGEKLRYVIAGVWNTAINVAVFNLLLLAFGHEHYLVWFWVAWAISVVQSTVTMKYFAFRRKGPLLPQVARAYVIYLPAQGLSTAIMWFAVGAAHVGPRLAQLMTIVVTTIFSYVGHKYFTFRVPLDTVEVAPEDMMTGTSAASD